MNRYPKSIFKDICHLLVPLVVAACNFTVSLPEDGYESITVIENGLSPKNVYLANGKKATEVRSFRYGQKIYTNFIDIDGFVEENRLVYPQMTMYVLSKAGDTIMERRNMFGDFSEGIDATDVTFHGHVVLARPIHSGKQYTLQYEIKDTKGNASLKTEMKLEVTSNPEIQVTTQGLTYEEAYLYSPNRKAVVNDGRFNFFEDMLFDFQDLEGYVVKDGQINLGMEVKVIDDDGTIILDMPDAFEAPINDEGLLKQGISSTLTVNKGQVANPLKWKVKIWDKNSDASLRAETEIFVGEL